MKTYLAFAPAPVEEDCAQVGTPGYQERALVECARFIRLLRTKFGPEPEGAWLSVKWFAHDFGPYCEVICYYNTDIQASVEYAYRCEDNLPATWDDSSIHHGNSFIQEALAMPRVPEGGSGARPQWLRALAIAKILFEDQGSHTVYLEEREGYLTEGYVYQPKMADEHIRQRKKRSEEHR